MADPQIKERFIYTPIFTNQRTKKKTKVRMLNFEGYLDYAHQKGLIELSSEILGITIEEKEVPVKGDDGKLERDKDGNIVSYKQA
jgi:hypothetical protein